MIFKVKTRPKMLYKDLIREWLDYKKYYIKESTYANYLNVVLNHIVPELGERYLHDLDNKVLQKFLLEKLQNGRVDKKGGLSNKTVKDMMIIIRSSLKYAIKEGYMPNINLELIYPKAIKKDKVYTLSKREQNSLTKYILEHETIKSLGILLTLYSGIRIGELCAIQWKDIDFKHNMLHIDKTLQRVYIKERENQRTKIIITNPKTHNAERVIPLNKNFAQKLKNYKTKDNDYLLSCSQKSIEPRTYRRYYDRILQKAKIRKFNFHGLRHTFATNCIKLRYRL